MTESADIDRYERAYGTDWDVIDVDEAIERSYALGVCDAIGESVREELDALRVAVDTAYARSVVDLAFDEGRSEARSLAADPDDEAERVWERLIDDVPAGEDAPADTPTGLPDAVERIEALDRPEMDRIDAIERPDFLDRE